MIRPPLWHGGKVYLHIIPEDHRHNYRDLDFRLLQAAADLGFMDAADLEIGPPDETTIGYPSARAT